MALPLVQPIWLHRFLLVCQCDTHLFERHLVECSGYFDLLGFLILPQTGAGVIVKFARLLARVKSAPLQDALSLFDLIFVRAKYWLSWFRCSGVTCLRRSSST